MLPQGYSKMAGIGSTHTWLSTKLRSHAYGIQHRTAQLKTNPKENDVHIVYVRYYETDIDDAVLVDCCRTRCGPFRDGYAGLQSIICELDRRELLAGTCCRVVGLVNTDAFLQDSYTPEELQEELAEHD